MTTASAEPEGPREFEGPDPHKWDAYPDLIAAVGDVRALDEMIAVLTGTAVQEDRGPARQEALAFLREAGYQAREVLARILLDMNGVEIPDTAASPFGRAGKVRAYTPGRPPPGNDRVPGAAAGPA